MTDFAADLARGRYDGEFWAWRFMGVRLHPGQVRVFQAALARQRARPWVAAYLTIALSAGNRAGKTLILALIVLHSVMYKTGTPLPTTPEEAQRWNVRPYLWFHFALQQEIADLVWESLHDMLAGVHLAQEGRGCPLVDEIREQGGAGVAEVDRKYKGDYRWIVLDPILGGGEIHFRSVAEKALGSLGRDMNGISFDECGLVEKLQWIVDNVLHLRRLGTGGQLLLFSTPDEGITEFADMWWKGDPEQPDRNPRRMSLRMSSRDNIGFGLVQEEFDALVADMDEDHIAQNIDGYFIQGRTAYFNAQSVDNAFVEGLPEILAAKNGHSYVQGVDLALKVDSVWSIVFDVRGDTAYGVQCQRLRGKRTTGQVVELAESVHHSYEQNRAGLRTHCSTAIDSTGMGGHMFREMMEAAIAGGVRSIEFGGTSQKKRKLLGDLRSMLDSGKLKMPRSGLSTWLAVRRQLAGYKLDDRHIEQDAVMALAIAVAEIRRTPSEALDSVSFDAFAVEDQLAPRNPSEWARTPYRHAPRAVN